MRTKRVVTYFALSTAFILACVSCNTEDPSAAGELQRDLAEALAKNLRLQEDVASLTQQLDAEKQSGAEAESMKMPTSAEIEQGLAIEGTKLKEEARKLHPNATVKSYTTLDLVIPSFETPFSCKVKVELLEPSGESKTVYWTGKATMKGEWKFEKAANLERTDTKPDIPLVDPVIEPRKQAPAPEKPEIKYDIPLKDPVLGPGSR